MHGTTYLRSALAISVALLLGGAVISGCGSDDSSDGSTTTDSVAKPADSGTTDSGKKDGAGEVTPKDKKPASAGDKKKNAPDEAISNRPGGPGAKPVQP